MTAHGKRLLICRLDGKHVVFGRVKDGMNIVNEIEYCGGMSGVPQKAIIILASGVLEQEKHNDDKHHGHHKHHI